MPTLFLLPSLLYLHHLPLLKTSLQSSSSPPPPPPLPPPPPASLPLWSWRPPFLVALHGHHLLSIASLSLSRIIIVVGSSPLLQHLLTMPSPMPLFRLIVILKSLVMVAALVLTFSHHSHDIMLLSSLLSCHHLLTPSTPSPQLFALVVCWLLILAIDCCLG